MNDLFGPVPAVDPDLALILGFLHSKGIRRHKANEKRARSLLRTYTAQQIMGGVVLGLSRAKGGHVRFLVYFENPIKEVAEMEPDYAKHLIRRG